MKKGLIILLLAVTTGILAFFLSRGKQQTAHQPLLLDAMPELTWLKTDLALSEEQFSQVQQLHRKYRPVCADMCRRIGESEKAVARLAGNQRGLNEELDQAIDNHARVIAACKRSMLEHIYKTASLMDEDQSKRYLEVALPLALDSARGRATTQCHE